MSAVPRPRDTARADPGAVARAILDGFDRHYRLFREASARAARHFAAADWTTARAEQRERILMYDRRVAETVAEVAQLHPRAEADETIWPEIKRAYVQLLAEHAQPECAETFFNSVACKLLHRSYFHNQYIFWRPAVATEHLEGTSPTYRCDYPVRRGMRRTLIDIARSFGFASDWTRLRRDVRNLLEAFARGFPDFRAQPDFQLHVLASPFYRNKAAYIVGRAINGADRTPFAVAVLKDADGRLYVDALLVGADQLELLFSFARAYFMVEMEVPSACVGFLASLMPDKPRGELYTLLGLQKHGKTLFYRELFHHLKHSSDRFEVAPGIRGMVMVVFTLPSFPYVFKVIRDRFAPPKDIDRQTVKEKYQLVKLHDRVGRMADTLEFSEVALPRERFSATLLAELRAGCAGSLIEEEEVLVLRHLYIERRMTPLNLYLAEAAPAEAGRALIDYGQAIKDLAAAGIFPGDMLTKNFGVTRHGRVVFYDYDEIQHMTECNFRPIPPPRTPEDELAAEPYWSVGANDVFPEQFGVFLVSEPRARATLLACHGDLLEPGFWRERQARIRAGILEDVFPYAAELRFSRARR